MTPSKTRRVYKPLAFENKHGHLPKAGSQLLLPATTPSTPGRTPQEHSEGSTGARTPPGAPLKPALPAHSPPALPSPQRGASDGVTDPHAFTPGTRPLLCPRILERWQRRAAPHPKSFSIPSSHTQGSEEHSDSPLSAFRSLLPCSTYSADKNSVLISKAIKPALQIITFGPQE